jgi:hypothetical protein
MSGSGLHLVEQGISAPMLLQQSKGTLRWKHVATMADTPWLMYLDANCNYSHADMST